MSDRFGHRQCCLLQQPAAARFQVIKVVDTVLNQARVGDVRSVAIQDMVSAEGGQALQRGRQWRQPVRPRRRGERQFGDVASEQKPDFRDPNRDMVGGMARRRDELELLLLSPSFGRTHARIAQRDCLGHFLDAATVRVETRTSARIRERGEPGS
jgi:hypothetical protein